MTPPGENSITASPISTRLSLVRGKVFKTLILVTFMLGFVYLADAQQQKKIPRIAFLGAASATSRASRLDAFRQGLWELGYVEGKNIIIEYRHAEGKFERLPELSAELAHLKVDIIVTQGSPAAEAARKTTSTIPIIMATGGDACWLGAGCEPRPAGRERHRIIQSRHRSGWETAGASQGSRTQGLPRRHDGAADRSHDSAECAGESG